MTDAITTELADRELGRRLHRIRGAHWYFGNYGDPYALILRGQSDDPSAYEERVREAGPLFRSRIGTWVTADPEVAAAVLGDARFGALDRAGRRPEEYLQPSRASSLGLDRAAYARLRRVAEPVLGADAAAEWRRLGEEVGRRLLGGLGPGFDLTADFARRLPALVLAAWLGVPGERLDAWEKSLRVTGPLLDGLLCPQTVAATRAADSAAEELRTLLDEVAAARLGGSGQGATARLISAGAAPDDAAAAAVCLVLSAVEPTTTLVCDAVRLLLDRPGWWRRLCDSPDLAPAAVRHTLRYAPPVRLESRVAHEDVTTAGRVLPAGSHVVVLVGAARRAGAPDAVHADLTDAPAAELPDDLWFALSGEFVGRIAETALGVLAEAAPGLRRDGDIVRWRRSPVLGRYARFPVAYS
ncbi:P450-derived glycosyltransferase activator [Streptomyces caniscabiei]|uniref:P450-derived glycosyltransferase activator n=1 Tax=Streptomyces caniscabiei TaxID=2746961 RepID=A0A927QHU9_9ACTN|nr:P450-derived glycosyltransferase activator [Streptomyces caniscabiei]MBD9726851.1 P450-derived glycosyltransferase activator [Streptomyces caniscabiei]MDX3513750.1 P450-derived glycosyltransferase activator [Streptomyces caniscabiei]MDX3722559.1 P450-derived glycosyltransferase activator [Streptomyces caniscabiei]WEO23272.1 P450-derived glycosyltransferase activator [Streptomyces caniscabiei]